MIVKILASGAGFSAVRYNTDKLEKGDAELVRISRFGMLDNDGTVRPGQIKNYLKAISATNKQVSKPQFHAVISCKGREMDKQQLASLAEKWLEKMGYGGNPSLIIFHSDTPNNHVHLVSTRVRPDGKKVDDRFERRRAQQYLRELMVARGRQQADIKRKELEAYRFSTLAQFRLLLERSGFQARLKDKQLLTFHQGGLIACYDVTVLEKRISQNSLSEKRLLQLRAIIEKYRQQADSSFQAERETLPGGRKGKVIAYHSPLTRLLNAKFGLEFVFHFQGDKPPYGYTVIDHAGKQVLKGGQLIKLWHLGSFGQAGGVSNQASALDTDAVRYRASSVQAAAVLAVHLGQPPSAVPVRITALPHSERLFYRELLSQQGQEKTSGGQLATGLTVLSAPGGSFLFDSRRKLICSLDEIVPDTGLQQSRSGFLADEKFVFLPVAGFGISPDEDDQLQHGRRRRGKNQTPDK